MLSILRKQSQQLEKELLEARQALDALKRQQAEHDAAILQKDEKIAELEEEIRHRRPLDELVLCRACGKPAEEEEEDWEKVEQEQAAAVSKAQKDELLQKLEELKKVLTRTRSDLTTAELQKSIAELQVLTAGNKVRREMSKEIDEAKAAARTAKSNAERDVAAAKAEARRFEDEVAAFKIARSEMQAGLARRDEQIEFLMQVHDASQEHDWVPAGGSQQRRAPPSSTDDDDDLARAIAASMADSGFR